MRFTLRQLQIFVAACDAGSLTIAAERLGIAQSAVSTAIKVLERSLGIQLLVRVHATGVSPTPEGRQFLRQARALLESGRELERFASDLGNQVAGPLSVGCLVTVAPVVMAGLIAGFQERYPAAKVELAEGGQDQLIERLRSGQISLALTYDMGLEHGIEFTPLLDAPPQVLLAADHPLAQLPSLTINDLRDLPMILLDLPISRDYFLGFFRAHVIQPKIVHRSPHMDIVRSMVGQGLGYSLINLTPGTDQTMDGRAVITRRFQDVRESLSLGIAEIEAARRSANTEAFVSYMTEWASSRT